MRTLVTGAAGFLGRHTVAELARRGHDVVAVVRPGTPLPAALERPEVDVLRADLRRPPADLWSELAASDAVVHLAAGMSGSPRARFDSTVLATERLLHAIKEQEWGGRLVHVSTCAVYPFRQLPAGAVIDERTPVDWGFARRDEYAWTKGWQERVVHELLDELPCEITIVRPGAVHGPGRTFQGRLGRRVGARVLLLFGGRGRMPLVQVDNVAALLAECTEHPRAAGETFNAIDPGPPRQSLYLRHWLRAQPGPVLVLPVPRVAYRAAGWAFERMARLTGGRVPGPSLLAPDRLALLIGDFRYDTTGPARILGWTPVVTGEEALRRTFAPTPRHPVRTPVRAAGVTG
jgi:nucleoside-diphosphate-sugar epimerase